MTAIGTSYYISLNNHQGIALKPRKYPSQSRSKVTVDSIIESAFEILIKFGYEKSTTQRIAERAGVSVGTLYQYFPNKKSIFTELQRHYADKLYEHLEKLLEPCRELPIIDAISLFVEGFIGHISKNLEIWHVLLGYRDHFLPEEERTIRNKRLLGLLTQNMSLREEPLRITDIEMASLLMINMCESITHSVITQYPEKLNNGSLEKELKSLLSSYIIGP
ncbi:TetR/AcrR family transcriptional regulator [Bacteriovoracales bacterium]|nr:TetR/AcrR family transcriptional regulator [Bacteriovoracales bacterium]